MVTASDSLCGVKLPLAQVLRLIPFASLHRSRSRIQAQKETFRKIVPIKGQFAWESLIGFTPWKVVDIRERPCPPRSIPKLCKSLSTQNYNICQNCHEIP
jgi:hypothetical protein